MLGQMLQSSAMLEKVWKLFMVIFMKNVHQIAEALEDSLFDMSNGNGV